MAVTVSKSATELFLDKVMGISLWEGNRVFIHNLLSRKYFKIKHFFLIHKNNAKSTYILRSILKEIQYLYNYLLE
jgi:hypothetical protein